MSRLDAGLVTFTESDMAGELYKLKAKPEVKYRSSQGLFSTIFQLYGSNYPKVVPFSIAAGLNGLFMHWVHFHLGIDLSVDTTGLNLIGTLVSFYLISATTASLTRYIQCKGFLGALNQSTLNLTHTVTLFGDYYKANKETKWRHKVFYHILLLNIVTLGVLNYRDSGKNVWELRDVPEEERKFLYENLCSHKLTRSKNDGVWVSGQFRPFIYENYRAIQLVILRLRLVLRKKGRKADKVLTTTTLDKSLHNPYLSARKMVASIGRQNCTEERKVSFQNRTISDIPSESFSSSIDEETVMSESECFPEKIYFLLMKYVEDYLQAVLGLQNVLVPAPFPLVKMRRALLFLWLYFLPYCFIANESINAYSLFFLMFCITMGFVGLEFVNIEIEDPFGDDLNDFDEVGSVRGNVDDILYALYQDNDQETVDRLQEEFSVFFKD